MSGTQTAEMALPASRDHQPSRSSSLPGSDGAGMNRSRAGTIQTLSMILVWGVAVPTTLTALDVPLDLARWVILIVSASAIHMFLRWGVGVSHWVAAPMVGVFLMHPLVREQWRNFEISSFGGIPWVASLLPLLLLAGLVQNTGRRTVAALLIGGALGAILGPHGTTIALIGTVYLIVGSTRFVTHRGAPRAAQRISPLRPLAAAAIPALAWLGASLAAAQGFAASEIQIAMGDAVAPPIGPVAWMDRGGVLVARLDGFPEELVGGSGAWYPGVSLIGLCLIGVWPRRGQDSKTGRMAAFLFALTAMTWWVTRGPKSTHDQLVELFQYAMVRRQTAVHTQQILGVHVLGMALFVVTAWAALVRLFAGTGKAKFWPLLSACVAVMMLWSTAWPEVFRNWAKTETLSTHDAGRILVALLLVSSAAAGVERAILTTRRRPSRMAVWLACVVVIVLDCAPWELRPDGHDFSVSTGSSPVNSEIGYSLTVASQ